MSAAIPGFPESPVRSGVSAAKDRLRRYNVEFDKEIDTHPKVRSAVRTAVNMIEEDPPPGPMTAPLIEFTVETVAFGAMSRIVSGDEEMDAPQIRIIKNIIRVIFNGLLDE